MSDHENEVRDDGPMEEMREVSVTLWLDHAAPWLNRVQDKIEAILPDLTERVSSTDLHLTLAHGVVPASQVGNLVAEITGFLGAEDRFEFRMGAVRAMQTPSGRIVIYSKGEGEKLFNYNARLNTLYKQNRGYRVHAEFIPHISLGFTDHMVTSDQVRSLYEIDGFRAVLVGNIAVSAKEAHNWSTVSTFRLYVDVDDSGEVEEPEAEFQDLEPESVSLPEIVIEDTCLVDGVGPSSLSIDFQEAQSTPSGLWDLLGIYQEEEDCAEFIQKPYAWHQGKYRILSTLKAHIPEHDIYVEPFCGGASLFWSKAPSRVEVLGDTDPVAIKLLAFMQGITPAACEILRNKDWSPRGEHAFTALKAYADETREVGPEFFFAAVYTRMWSYQGRGDKYFDRTSRSTKPPKFLDRLEEYRDRLQGVNLVHGDGLLTIKQHDKPETFMYLDPPYSHRRKDVMSYDPSQLVDYLSQVKAKVLLSHDQKSLMKGASGKGNRWLRSEVKVKSARADKDAYRTEYLFRNYV